MSKGSSRLLIDEEPLQVVPSLAAKLGINRAVFVQQLHYWLQKPGAHVKAGPDGVTRRWIYNTYEAWHEQFPFWEPETIRKLVRGLEKSKLVLTTTRFNQDKRDRTKWYGIDYEVLDALLPAPGKDPDAPEESPDGPEKSTDHPEDPTGSQPEDPTGSNIETETTGIDSALQAGGAPEKTPEKPTDARAYCGARLSELIQEAELAGKRVEPLPDNKKGEYANIYAAYLAKGYEVAYLERVLSRLVARASERRSPDWVRFAWAALDVAEGKDGGDSRPTPRTSAPTSLAANTPEANARRKEGYEHLFD